jgi:glycosyltransferase involved in cell wall biosynthesis
MAMRNAERTLPAALASLAGQTYRNWELILLDDGSTDGSVAVGRAFADDRAALRADGMHRGLATRLNEAIDLARGKYLARMDADDVCYPERFERQVAFLEAHGEVDLAGCGALVFGESGHPLGRFPLRTTHDEICADPWSGFYLAHPGWMGRTAWFRRNPYRADYRKTQDQDLLLRTFDSSRFACLPELLLGYRMAASPLSKRLRGRAYFSRSILREAGRRRMYGAALRGVALQLAKAGADCLAAALPGAGRGAARRLGPLTDAEREAWRELWRTFRI